MEERHPSRITLLIALTNLAGAPIFLGAQDPCLVLSSASVSSNEFKFTLNAESGVSYTIQASTNLLDWITVGTNAGPGITRAITITNPPDGQSFYRATRGPLPLFRFALAANNVIVLSSSSVVDSYNSFYGPYSSTNRGAGGSIATNSRQINAINVGAAHVYGTVSTGPGGTTSVTDGAVGDFDWNATQSGIQPGWASDDMNVCFPTNPPPSGPFSLLPLPTIVGVSNITYVPTGKYTAASFTSSSSTKPMIVTGNAIIYLTGNVTVSGDGYILIQPGASLTLYVGGNNPTISGGGVINGTELPTNFSYVGLPSSTKLTYSGSTALVGAVTAPQGAVTLSGGAGLYGACVANSITLSGGFSVHYDESLAASGPRR